jgi:serine/threonine protein kinase
MNLKVIKQLGAGGFGTVELVADNAGRQYARKTFSLHQQLGPILEQNVKKRFVREAKIQQSLVQKNIVSGVRS